MVIETTTIRVKISMIRIMKISERTIYVATRN